MKAVPIHPVVDEVTRRIAVRSESTRRLYLAQTRAAYQQGPQRAASSCTNLAHTFAAAETSDKLILRQSHQHANIAIISAYNDLLSAHQPYHDYPQKLKREIHLAGHVAQFAGGVPAMCDGITQGQPGMELSLFSRDVIAQATAVALTHHVFDGVLALGICDKIVPGMLMGALQFGHLPFILVPSGPMPSGLPNQAKAAVRQQFAAGLVDQAALLESEAQSYHAPGTCTFYGTANSNQLLMEVMGLMLPGAAFVQPATPLREALTLAAARRIVEITGLADEFRPLGELVDERTLVNAVVALLATGGSTNHTLHLIAIARCAGIRLDWDDFATLSRVVPLLARIYPNGAGDINQFHEAGGTGFLLTTLLSAGLLHSDAQTVWGRSLGDYIQQPRYDDQSDEQACHGQQDGQSLQWSASVTKSGNPDLLRPVEAPFNATGGLSIVSGNLGRAVVKTSAVPEIFWQIEAPARVFAAQQDLIDAYEGGRLLGDFVAVLPAQGPAANGMPELHKLMPALTNLQNNGQRVALVTDGRMSGASGSVLCAIHLTPEAAHGGAIARIAEGDRICIDARSGLLQCDPLREEALLPLPLRSDRGYGRGLFKAMRKQVNAADKGAMTFGWDDDNDTD